MSRKDQLTAPMPPVVFATQQAAEKVVGDLKSLFNQAAHHAESQGTLAVQKSEEIRVLQQEVNERMAWISQKQTELDQFEAESRAARDVARGYADMLAAAGVHVPPPGGEQSWDPDGNIARLGAAHDELERVGGHS
ncbi:hypothetical protein ACWEJ6_21240 [Nonomuraea sp. NPDC004702]